MANLTQTLKVQTINEFGPSPSTKWGSTFRWTAAGVGPGNGTWGVKSAGSLGSQPILKNLFKKWTGTSVTPVSGMTNLPRYFNKVFSKPIISVYRVTDKEQSDGKGYLYVVPDRTTNEENKFIPLYGSAAAASTAYISAAVSVTTWK